MTQDECFFFRTIEQKMPEFNTGGLELKNSFILSKLDLGGQALAPCLHLEERLGPKAK